MVACRTLAQGHRGYFEVIDTRRSPKVLVELSKAAGQGEPTLRLCRPSSGRRDGTVRALVGSGTFGHLLRDDL